MYSPNTKISSVHLKQAVLHHEETSRDCQETQGMHKARLGKLNFDSLFMK